MAGGIEQSARGEILRRVIIELIAEGYSTAEIGRALWITEDTVRTHIKRMLARMGARTRAHGVAIAFREGLLEGGRRVT